MSELLYGAPAAQAILDSLEERIYALRMRGREPCLAMLRCGEDPGALSYERAAARSCSKAGIQVRNVVLPWSAGTEDLLREVDRVNGDQSVHGILVLRPLPKQIDTQVIFRRLRHDKDVDGITVPSLARVFVGRGGGFAPCTPEACIAMLDHYGVPLTGARVVILGRSLIVGRPLSMLLIGRDATVTLCHSRTRDPAALCREADILLAADGKAKFVDENYVNPHQVILDVGVNEGLDGTICGDVAFERVSPLVRAISPVPRGVGTVTTAVLARHVVEAAETLF